MLLFDDYLSHTHPIFANHLNWQESNIFHIEVADNNEVPCINQIHVFVN